MTRPDPVALAQLHAQCFTTPPPWSPEAFAAQIGTPHSILIAMDSGFALGHALAGEAELLTMAVAPAWRRCGHGRELLNAFLRTARARGADAAYLEVAAGNCAARALYAGAGFVRVGRRQGCYRTPEGGAEDALVLHRDLRDLPPSQLPPAPTG